MKQFASTAICSVCLQVLWGLVRIADVRCSVGADQIYASNGGNTAEERLRPLLPTGVFNSSMSKHRYDALWIWHTGVYYIT